MNVSSIIDSRFSILLNEGDEICHLLRNKCFEFLTKLFDVFIASFGGVGLCSPSKTLVLGLCIIVHGWVKNYCPTEKEKLNLLYLHKFTLKTIAPHNYPLEATYLLNAIISVELVLFSDLFLPNHGGCCEASWVLYSTEVFEPNIPVNTLWSVISYGLSIYVTNSLIYSIFPPFSLINRGSWFNYIYRLLWWTNKIPKV